MKIVHTFWTRGATDLKHFGAGWRTPLDHYCSWALSAWQAKKTHGRVELVTDVAGAKMLLNVLRLPYDRVDTSLEQFDFPARFWSAAKVYAYGLQKDPFVHIDGDVHLWKKLPEDFLSAPVLSQSIEHVRNVALLTTYVKSLALARRGLRVMPECWNKHHFNALNCGFFGGNDLDSIGKYVSEAGKLWSPENRPFWDSAPANYTFGLNCSIEQWTAYAVMKGLGVPVSPLLRVEEKTAEGESRVGFSHAMFRKKGDGACEEIRKAVLEKYPSSYHRLVGWLKG